MSLARAFQFTTVPNLLVETGASGKVGELAKSLGCRSVVLVTDKVLRSLGLTEAAEKGCAEAGIRCSIFDAVEEDPPERVVNDLVRFCRDEAEADGVVGLGGGSPMDCAKLAAFLCGDTQQSIADCYGVGVCEGQRLPLIQVPTTAGGLERPSSSFVVLFRRPLRRPRARILPASATLTLYSHAQAPGAKSLPSRSSPPASRRRRALSHRSFTRTMRFWTVT